MRAPGKPAAAILAIALGVAGCAANEGPGKQAKQAAGGAPDSWIGNRLDEKDRRALAASTHLALSSGRNVDWKSDHSGASAVIQPVSSKTITRQAQVQRSPVAASADNLSVWGPSAYYAVQAANLRAAPNITAEKIGGLTAGQSFTALGKLPNWVAVSRKGVLVGYVSAPLVAPVPAARARADQSTDLDSISAAQAGNQGFNLDALEPARPVTENIPVQTTCRTMKYDVKTSEGQESKTVDACQSVDGSWRLG